MSKQQPYSKQSFIDIIRGEKKWDKQTLKPIKDDIRDYLYNINNNRCFFCKSKINNGSNNETIEHILSKDKYPNFTFNPYNLTLACSDCNRIKNAEDVLNKNIQNAENLDFDYYPSNSNDYIIVHPYFDDYSDHIYIDDIFYLGKDYKGKNTIKFYNLTRLSLAEIKVKEKREETTKINLAKNLIKNNSNNMNNIDAEVESIVVSGSLMSFINNKINSQNRWSEDVIHIIENLDINKVAIFKSFKMISHTYYDIDENFKSKSDFLNGIDADRIYVVEEILLLLQQLLKYADDRRKIYTLLYIKYSSIENFFSDYKNKLDNNIQLKILFRFGKLMSLIKEYNFTYNGTEILEELCKDEILISNIKEKFEEVQLI